MSDLKKAITQDTLTPGTVDAQFCSDWLKDQIMALFSQLAEMTKEIESERRRGDCWRQNALEQEKQLFLSTAENLRLREALNHIFTIYKRIRMAPGDKAYDFCEQALSASPTELASALSELVSYLRKKDTRHRVIKGKGCQCELCQLAGRVNAAMGGKA